MDVGRYSLIYVEQAVSAAKGGPYYNAAASLMAKVLSSGQEVIDERTLQMIANPPDRYGAAALDAIARDSELPFEVKNVISAAARWQPDLKGHGVTASALWRFHRAVADDRDAGELKRTKNALQSAVGLHMSDRDKRLAFPPFAPVLYDEIRLRKAVFDLTQVPDGISKQVGRNYMSTVVRLLDGYKSYKWQTTNDPLWKPSTERLYPSPDYIDAPSADSKDSAVVNELFLHFLSRPDVSSDVFLDRLWRYQSTLWPFVGPGGSVKSLDLSKFELPRLLATTLAIGFALGYPPQEIKVRFDSIRRLHKAFAEDHPDVLTPHPKYRWLTTESIISDLERGEITFYPEALEFVLNCVPTKGELDFALVGESLAYKAAPDSSKWIPFDGSLEKLKARIFTLTGSVKPNLPIEMAVLLIESLEESGHTHLDQDALRVIGQYRNRNGASQLKSLAPLIGLTPAQNAEIETFCSLQPISHGNGVLLSDLWTFNNERFGRKEISKYDLQAFRHAMLTTFGDHLVWDGAAAGPDEIPPFGDVLYDEVSIQAAIEYDALNPRVCQEQRLTTRI